MSAADSAFGVYVHWPFCLAKCPYCDFNSHVRHEAPDEARFARAIATELAHFAERTGPRFRVGDSGFALRKTPIIRQPSSWQAVLLPPGGAPEPPGAVIARHDSGRHTLPRDQDAS